MKAEGNTRDPVGKWTHTFRRFGVVASLCLSLLLATLLALWISPSSLRGEDERPTDRLVLLYTGETHGNVEPCG